MPAWFRARVARNNRSRTLATARSMRSKMSGLMLTVCGVQRWTSFACKFSGVGMCSIMTNRGPRRKHAEQGKAVPRLLTIRRKAPRRFPQLAFDDRKASAGGKVKNQPGNVFGRRVFVHEKQGLTHFLQ